jgi:6-phosphogluconolactonase (cycloisomerase 2 family)
MFNQIRSTFVTLGFALLFIFVTQAQADVVGYLYTTTNGTGENQVVKFSRNDDGSLTDEVAYNTGSMGGANPAAGGDAHGDFDTQGAIQIIDNYLLNVNAGGNTVSIFALDRETGDLTLKGNVDSGGTRPTSITYTQKPGMENEYWVVVGNQWNNPNVQKDTLERYPDDAFHAADLTSPDPSDEERNIQLFTFNTSTGAFTSVARLDTYVRENGGPATVTFSDDGTKLAVSTWGIAHFSTENPSLEEQHPSRVYVYDFDKEAGTISGERFFEEKGISGSIGLNWAKGSNEIMHVSNFNLIAEKSDHGLTVLSDNGMTVSKVGNYTTGAEEIDEACWTLLSPSGDRLYVASFAGNLITPFELDAEGNVTKTLPFEARGDLAPAGDSKDMYISPDNQYLYNLGAFLSHSINVFKITDTGLEYQSQLILETTSDGQEAGSYNFLGLAGFDK